VLLPTPPLRFTTATINAPSPPHSEVHGNTTSKLN
jgi:hypothetical protein